MFITLLFHPQDELVHYTTGHSTIRTIKHFQDTKHSTFSRISQRSSRYERFNILNSNKASNSCESFGNGNSDQDSTK